MELWIVKQSYIINNTNVHMLQQNLKKDAQNKDPVKIENTKMDYIYLR
jgi:hypothetical protein